MNKFQQSENLGRSLFNSFLQQSKANNIQFTEGDYNPVDVYFNLEDKKIVGEIKVRDVRYKDYPTHIMEQSKFNNLCKAKSNGKCADAIYINFFGSDWLYIYSLKAIKNNSVNSQLYCNKTTAINTGKVNKAILEINPASALIYKYENGKWIKYCPMV